MKCDKCGNEITNVLVNEFQYNGADGYRVAAIEDLGDEVYGVSTTHNWTGDGLDDAEDLCSTIACPCCGKYPFKSKEIAVQEIVQLTFWNTED